MLVGSFLSADDPMVIGLWPNGAPEDWVALGPELIRISPSLERRQMEVTESSKMITNVNRPTIMIRRPSRELDKQPHFGQVTRNS